MMDSISSSKEGHFDIDLEKGRLSSSELSSSGNLVFGSIRMDQLHSDPINGGIRSSNGSTKVEEGVISTVNPNCKDGSENLKVKGVEKKSGEQMIGCFSEKRQSKEKPKAMSAKKPPRPPRPPRGLSLDSADQKLIKELQELAKLKRARIERMKALKAAKEAKTSSSKNHIFATLLTVLFALVLLLQGISSRTRSAANFKGSPISSTATDSSVVSLQQHTVQSQSNFNEPNYESPGSMERPSSLDKQEKLSSAAG